MLTSAEALLDTPQESQKSLHDDQLETEKGEMAAGESSSCEYRGEGWIGMNERSLSARGDRPRQARMVVSRKCLVDRLRSIRSEEEKHGRRGEKRGIGKRGRTVEDDDRIQRLVGPSVAARGRGGGHGRSIHAHGREGRKEG